MSLRNDFMDMVKAMRALDIPKTPDYLTTKALFEAFKKHGLSDADAGTMAGNVVIDVTEAFVNDKELFTEVVDAYADMLYRVRIEMSKLHPNIFNERMKVSPPSLKYSV